MGYTPSAGLHTHLLGPIGNLETHTSIGVLAGAGPFPRVSEHSAGDRFSSEAVGVWYHLETNAPKRVLPLAYSNTEQVLAAPGCYASDASCRPQQAGSRQRARRGSTKPTSVQTKRRTSPARSAALGGWPCSPLDVMPPHQRGREEMVAVLPGRSQAGCSSMPMGGRVGRRPPSSQPTPG